jgi:8-amino-7-oxononanoate synthase
MSLLDKFSVQRGLAASLAENSRVAPIATPMDDVHSATSATINGRRVILAGTNNYLGLTYDADCRAAAIAAIESLGTGTTGSRMASGNYAGHRALEHAIASAFGWPAAIAFASSRLAAATAAASCRGPSGAEVAGAVTTTLTAGGTEQEAVEVAGFS